MRPVGVGGCMPKKPIPRGRVREEGREGGREGRKPLLCPCIQYQSTHTCVCRVEIWPGFITSILSYEHHVMLCAEISHKMLRTITVLEMMYDLYASVRRDFHAEATRKLVGTIVMTR